MKRLSPSVCVALLALITAASLVPFADKAFHIDDPLFLWTARQIQAKPLDFYGFTVNWYGNEEPMSAVTKNPPLAAYYLAGAASVLGWSERALHLAFLLPAVAAVLGVYRLARGLCSRPFLAALLVALSPVFLLSSTSLMCDTMMLAFWVWAVFFWIRGLSHDSKGCLTLAAVLASLSFLTKYFGLSLVPLLASYAWSKRQPLRCWAPFLLIPLAMALAYEEGTLRLYGSGLLSEAAAYSQRTAADSEFGALAKLLIGLAFLGGCFVPTLFYAPLLWARRKLMFLGGLVLLCVLPVIASGRIGWFPLNAPDGLRWDFVAQLGTFVFGGVGLLALTATVPWQLRGGEADASPNCPRSPEHQLREEQTSAAGRAGAVRSKGNVGICRAEMWLLALWCGGTFIFASLLNWTVNGRSILPLTPAAAILLVRRLELARGWTGARSPAVSVLPLCLSALVGFGITWADYQLANSARSAVETLKPELVTGNSPVWFQGHWGFQYYMEIAGAKALDFGRSKLSRGDLLVSPQAGANFDQPGDGVALVRTMGLPSCRWLTPWNDQAGAGFYSDVFGPLPYAIMAEQSEEYGIYEVTNTLLFSGTTQPVFAAEECFRRGMTLAKNRDWEGAAHEFRLAVKLNPGFAQAHHQWGMTLLLQHKTAEALDHWRQAARLNPNWPEPLNNLAWVLATDPHPELRNGVEAVRCATRAAELAGTNDVRILDTLAAAYAETGDYEKAVVTALRAKALAIAETRQPLATQLDQCLELYRSRQPYREEFHRR